MPEDGSNVGDQDMVRKVHVKATVLLKRYSKVVHQRALTSIDFRVVSASRSSCSVHDIRSLLQDPQQTSSCIVECVCGARARSEKGGVVVSAVRLAQTLGVVTTAKRSS